MKDRILNALMLAAVAAALALTLLRTEPDKPLAPSVQAPPAAAVSPAEAYRARRKETREMERKMLLTLLESEYTAPETKAQAERQLSDLSAYDETELAVEAALSAHGYANALCVSRAGSLTVFLPQEITQEEAGFFLEIAAAASGLSRENIRLTGM